MKRILFVLALGLIFVSANSFAVDFDKDAYYSALDAAKVALDNGQDLTEQQEKLLRSEGVINDHQDELDRTDGPDGFGYFYFDNDEPNGPAYDWIDIIETGEALQIPGDDDYTGPFDIGFDFEFYGNTYDQFYLGSNGMIGFETGGMGSLGNHNFPNPSTPNNIIAWFWDDMDPANGADGMAYIENFGDYTVIQFDDWDHYPNGPDQGNIDAEIILYDTGDIVIQYHSWTDNLILSSCTIGIEGPGGQAGIMYAYNNANDVPAQESAVGFTINEGGFADPNASVEGVVTNSCNGDAVEGAEVYFGNQMATTDADGYYMIEGVYSRGYTARVMAEGFAMAEVDVELEEGENVVDIEMDPWPTLGFDPDQFTFDVGWLGSDSDILTISNTADCGANLDWEIEITYIEEEIVAQNRTRERRSIERTVQNIVERSGILDGPITLNNGTNAVGETDNQVLTDAEQIAFTHYPNINYDELARRELDTPPDILIYPADSYYPDVVEKIENLEFFNSVTFINAQNTLVSLEELMEFDAVITWANSGYVNAAGVGDVLADYVDEGGGVVVAVFATASIPIQGRFNAEGYYAIPPSGQTQGTRQTMGEIFEPNHFILTDVEEVDGGSATYHQTSLDVAAEASRIVDWTDGSSLVATMEMENTMRVDLGLFPPSSDARADFWETFSNGDILMGNALLYAADAGGSWLSVDPGDGSIAPGELMDLDVTVDASQVELPGVYEASIDIFYNLDSEEPMVETVWVTMTVGDPGTIEGIVSNSETGDPIVGAMVTIWGDLEEPVAELETDEDGYYAYPLGTGDWDVMADAPGYYPSDILIADLIEGETTILDIELDREVPAELVVDPDVFDFEVGWLGSDSDIITIGNFGGLPADWGVDVTYIEEEIAARGNNREARREAVVENWIARSGILDGPLTSYPLETTIGANGPDVVTRPEQIARVINGNGELDDANILLYPADTDGYPEDVANKLAALELFETITIVSARFVVPTLEELMEFDAVMTWTNYGYLDRVAVGDVMADYVDEGYGVVHAVFESAGVYMLGRWNAEQYYAFPTSGNQFGPQQTLGEVFEANHLMMEEIETLDIGTSSYRQSTFDVHPEALRIADWSDGRAVAAVREELDNGVTVALGMFPPSNDVINGGWNPASDCDRLMANALLVASGGGFGWITIEPDGGYLDIDEETESDILVDAINVPLPGVYEAILEFNVSYPDTLDPVTAWVTLVVGDPGTLEGIVSDDATGDPIFGATVTIWGDQEEPVAEIETDEDGYYAYPLGTGDWDVQATATDYYDSDVMTVALVEGETTTLDIELVHHVPPFATLNPDEFVFVIPEEGDTDSDIMTIGNTGGLDMNWDAGVVYIEDEEVNSMRENVRDYLLNRTVEAGAVDYTRAPSIDLATYPNTPTPSYYNELDDPYFLIIQDGNAWGAPAHQTILDELMVPYDMINSGQMADHPLDEYTCIIFTSVQSQNFLNTVQNNEERFTDFMGDGGWIIFGGCTQNYNWNLWDMSNTYGGDGIGVNNMPEHPIMEGIPEQWTGNWDSHDYINNVPEDANVITVSGVGNATLIEVEFGRGTLLLSTMTWEIGWNQNPMWGNGDVLINTIGYAVLGAGQGGWLSLEPGDGFVPIGEEMDIDLIADVTDLEMEEGTYEAMIEIDPNHHEAELATAWVTLIYGAGGIFNPVPPNGLPYPIIIDGVFQDDEPVPVASGVAVFDGDLCVGAVALNGEFPRSMIAWEMSEEPPYPGFTPGNPMTFQVWNSVTGEIFEAEADFTVGNGEFGFGPYSQVTVGGEGGQGEPDDLEIPLQGNYFELISSYIQPENLNALDIFGDIPDLAIVYQNDGGIVIPPFINTIGNMSMNQGYRIFCDENSMVTFMGEPIPTNTEYGAVPNRWNWVGYPFDHDVNPIDALDHIRDFVEIVQTDDGGVWIPPLFDINTIGEMTPGEGYMFFVNDAVDFTFNDPAVADRGNTEVWDIPVVEGAPQPTGLPYTVVLAISDELRALEPAIIELYDGKTLVGKSVVLDDRDYTPVTTWKGDADRNLEGFVEGNSIRFVVKAADGTVLPVIHNNEEYPEFGKGAYTLLNLDSAPIPTEFTVDQGYPNPFNPSVTVPFALPKNGDVTFAVFNVLGQQVFSTTQNYKAGYHRFVFDANQAGTELVSGVYFMMTQFNGQNFTQKVTLLK